jgi:hypothetical protein
MNDARYGIASNAKGSFKLHLILLSCVILIYVQVLIAREANILYLSLANAVA